MKALQTIYPVKPDSIGPPKIYLGANIQKIEGKGNNVKCWGLSAERYVREAVRNAKEKMKQDRFTFNKKLSDIKYSPQSPFSNVKYRPELDTSLECSEDQTQYFQSLIGILRWIIELGKIDICFEVSALSHYCCNPRVGYLTQAFHIFKYLDIHKENFIAFDPTYLDLGISSNHLESPDVRPIKLKEYYPDEEEALPTNTPPPRGKLVQINYFEHSDHAGLSLADYIPVSSFS